MNYRIAGHSDIGLVRKKNQDSLLVRHGVCELGEVVMAIMCDGMGGLSFGELASAEAVRAFAAWWDTEMPEALAAGDLGSIGTRWSELLLELNDKLWAFSERIHMERGMGTTFTGVLFVGDMYVFAHVGDSRMYHIADTVSQLTDDHSLVAQQVRLGYITPEEAESHPQRNVLTMCIGASDEPKPQVGMGRTAPGTYLLCSDGFRHELTNDELLQTFGPQAMEDEDSMQAKAEEMTELVKARHETDNISVILVRAV